MTTKTDTLSYERWMNDMAANDRGQGRGWRAALAALAAHRKQGGEQ